MNVCSKCGSTNLCIVLDVDPRMTRVECMECDWTPEKRAESARLWAAYEARKSAPRPPTKTFADPIDEGGDYW